MNLTEDQWRIVHNALASYQSRQTSSLDEFKPLGHKLRDKIQVIMDKVRDEHIKPTLVTPDNVHIVFPNDNGL